MSAIDDIIASPLKPKEKLARLSAEVLKDKGLVAALAARFEQGKDPVKGLCMETLELVSQDKPEWVAPQAAFVIAQLGHKAPRVKWEAARTVANLAATLPDKVAAAVPALLRNAADPGTVVRWSAAFALSEIAIYNKTISPDLLPKLRALEKKEANNGVRKIYAKALKQFATDA